MAALPIPSYTCAGDDCLTLASVSENAPSICHGKPDTYDLVQIAALHLCVASALHCDEQLVTVSTVFLRTNDEREWTFGPGIAEYRARIIDIAHEIRQAMPDAARFAPTPGPFCRNCPYIGLCPAAPDEFK